jgi:hypothetical protein
MNKHGFVYDYIWRKKTVRIGKFQEECLDILYIFRKKMLKSSQKDHGTNIS